MFKRKSHTAATEDEIDITLGVIAQILKLAIFVVRATLADPLRYK